MALNNRMKEVQKAALKDEKHTIQLLQRIYEQAAKDTEAKIAALNARTDLQNIQSIVYQKQYQEALKKQLDGIINDLHTQSFTTVSDYLGKSYEHGFYGTLYDLQGQGVPFLFPIRQDEVVKALNNDYSNIAKTQRGKDIYKRMGENTDYLKKSVRAEVSRGIANGSSWLDMATHVAKGMNSPFNRAMNRAFLITRTEGHRVQNQATMDVQTRARSLGADVVKQWDATLDANTRPWHADADGQIREIDEEFDVGGEKMKAPGIGGSARNVCNCRCVLLQRARWALNKNETRYLGDVSSMTDKQKEDIANKLGVNVSDLPNISKSIVPIHAKDYDDFREQVDNPWGFPKSEKTYSIHADATMTNIDYNTGKPEYHQNCGYCSAAYEMRRRGFDVEAKPKKGLYVADWKNLFEGFDPKPVTAKRTTTALKEIEQTALSWGNGSRGGVFVVWKGASMGHFFNFEVEDSTVVFVDGQNGRIGDSVRDYFKRVRPSSILYGRLDDKQPSKDIVNAVRGVIQK